MTKKTIKKMVKQLSEKKLQKENEAVEIYRFRLLLDTIEENSFLKKERERLIKKLEKIDNLSRYAWTQVHNNPSEAEELFKMINLESK